MLWVEQVTSLDHNVIDQTITQLLWAAIAFDMILPSATGTGTGTGTGHRAQGTGHRAQGTGMYADACYLDLFPLQINECTCTVVLITWLCHRNGRILHFYIITNLKMKTTPPKKKIINT